MGLFFPDDKELDLPIRKVGFPRYRELLEQKMTVMTIGITSMT